MKLLNNKVTFDARACGALCDDCPIKKPQAVAPEIHRGAKLLIMGESPGYYEVFKGKPFVGPTGEWVMDVLVEYKLRRSEFSWMNSCACPMPQNFGWTKRKKMVDCCRPMIEEVVRRAAPTTIMACGQGALYATIKKHQVSKHVGVVSPGVDAYEGIHILPNYHPTFAGLRRRPLRPYWVTYLLRAVKTSNFGPATWMRPKYYVDVNNDAFEALRALRDRTTPIAVDIETAGINPLTAPVMCVGLGDELAVVSLPWESYHSVKYGDIPGLVTYGRLGERCRRLVEEILQQPGRILVTQNGQHDLLGLQRYGIKATNGFDTLRAFSAVAPQSQGYRGLEELCVLHFDGCPRWKTAFRTSTTSKGAEAFIERDEHTLRTYNCDDVFGTVKLRTPLMKRLDETPNGWENYNRLMFQDEIAAKARKRGILIDPERVKWHTQKLKKKAYDKRLALRKIAIRYGFYSFNPDSVPQRNKFFFKSLGAQPGVYSEKTGAPSLNEKALDKLLLSDDKLVVRAARHMKRYRTYTQYLKILKSIHLDAGNVLRAEPNVDGAQTGRWSYTSPNIHTIPKSKYGFDAKGKRVLVTPGLRDIFVARPGQWIVEADYARLELYIIGVLAQDEIILNAWEAGEDLHSKNCVDLFGKYDKSLRTLAKRFVYNVNYGNTNKVKLAKGCFETLKVEFPDLSYPLIHHLVERWFKVHHWIDSWRANELKMAREQGYSVEPVSGRRRYYYGDVKDTEVYNFKMQTLGAYLIGRALKRVDAQLDWAQEGLLVQVHDALILEGSDPEKLCTVLKATMTEPIEIGGKTYSFPIDWKVGKSWGAAVECESLDDVRKLICNDSNQH